MTFSNFIIFFILSRFRPPCALEFSCYEDVKGPVVLIPDDCYMLASGVVPKRELSWPPWLILMVRFDLGCISLSIFWTVNFASLNFIGVKLIFVFSIVLTIGLNRQFSIPGTGLIILR